MADTKESKFLSTYAELNRSPSVLLSALSGFAVADMVSSSCLKNTGPVPSSVTAEELSSLLTGDDGKLTAMVLICTGTVFSDDWRDGNRIFENLLLPLGENVDFADVKKHHGHAICNALLKFSEGCPPELCGSFELPAQDATALARIIPFSIRLAADCRLCIGERSMLVHEYTSLTHQNPESLIACGFFSEIIRSLIFMDGTDIPSAIRDAYMFLHFYYKKNTSLRRYLRKFSFLLHPEIFARTEQKTFFSSMKQDFPLLQVLKTALYCLLNTSSYKECVRMALGSGICPDISPAIAGALAGLAYGTGGICPEWLLSLKSRNRLKSMCSRCIRYGAPLDMDSVKTGNPAV